MGVCLLPAVGMLSIFWRCVVLGILCICGAVAHDDCPGISRYFLVFFAEVNTKSLPCLHVLWKVSHQTPKRRQYTGTVLQRMNVLCDLQPHTAYHLEFLRCSGGWRVVPTVGLHFATEGAACGRVPDAHVVRRQASSIDRVPLCPKPSDGPVCFAPPPEKCPVRAQRTIRMIPVLLCIGGCALLWTVHRRCA